MRRLGWCLVVAVAAGALWACDDFDSRAEAERCRIDPSVCTDSGTAGGAGGGAAGGGGGGAADAGAGGGGPDAGTDGGVDGGVTCPGRTCAGPSNGEQLTTGTFAPSASRVRSTAAGAVGGPVVSTLEDVAWAWFGPADSFSTVELSVNDGGAALGSVNFPFRVLSLGAADTRLAGSGVGGVERAQLYERRTQTVDRLGSFNGSTTHRHIGLADGGGPKLVMVGDSDAGVFGHATNTFALMPGTSPGSSNTMCTGPGDARQLLMAPAGGASFIVAQCGTSLTEVYEYDAVQLSKRLVAAVGDEALVGYGPGFVLWLADQATNQIHLSRLALQGNRQPVATVDGVATISGLASYPGGVFLALTTRDSALSVGSSVVAPSGANRLALLQFDNAGTLIGSGVLLSDVATTTPNGLQWIGNRLAVSGTCQSATGFCVGVQPQAFLLFVTP